jgi:hypothetical protein
MVDFFLNHSITEPLPCPGLAVPHAQEHRFGFQADTVLTLIVKRSV